MKKLVAIIGVLFLILLFGSVVTGCVGLAVGTAEWHADQAGRLEEQGHYDEAIANLEKIITLTDNPQLIEMARQFIEELSK